MKKALFSLLFITLSFCGLAQDFKVVGQDTVSGAMGHLFTLKPTYYKHPLQALNDTTVTMDTANYYISTFAQNGTADSSIITFAGGRRLAAKAGSGTTYTFSTGLTNIVGTVTNNLSTGIAGSQSVVGGTAGGETLTLSSTSNGTKGKIIFGTASAYDQVQDRIGIGTTSPGFSLDVETNTNGVTRLFGKNSSSGITAQTIFEADNNSSHAFQMGMTSSGYTPTNFITADAGFMQTSATDLFIKAGGAKDIYFASNTNLLGRWTTAGNFGIGVIVPTAEWHLGPGNYTTGGGVGSAPLKFTASTVLTTTAASGTGSVVTLTFASQTFPPFRVGSTVVVAGVTPSGYNGTVAVLSCTTTTITYSNTTTGAQSVAGTITQGGLITTPEAGAVEYEGTHFYGTSSTLVRQQMDNGPITITTGINAKTTATTTLYTVPAGRTLIVTNCIVRVTAASSITVGLSASVTASTSGTIYASSAMTTLTATPQIFQFPTSGISVSASGGETIGFVIGTGATGTSQTVAVDLIGYLL